MRQPIILPLLSLMDPLIRTVRTLADCTAIKKMVSQLEHPASLTIRTISTRCGANSPNTLVREAVCNVTIVSKDQMTNSKLLELDLKSDIPIRNGQTNFS